MNITVCGRSVGIGVILGAGVLGTVWYGNTLNANAAIIPALLAAARCDAGGLVNITFPDNSQFTYVPAQHMPPTSYEEAKRRKRATP